MECPKCGSDEVEVSKYEAKCKRCGHVFPAIPEHVRKTFEKYPFATYCMDCGVFVSSVLEHIAKGHIVVRRAL